MGILSWKGGHSYFRVPTRSPKSNSRLGEPEGNKDKFKQLETEQSSIQSYQQTIGFNQTECKKSNKLCQLEARSIGGGNRCIYIIMDGQASLCLPSIFLIPRCLAKVEKKGGANIVTPSWQTQAFYPVLLIIHMTEKDPILKTICYCRHMRRHAH